MLEQKILSLLQQKKTIALVTIIDKNGSAPRLPGSKMVVDKSGILFGTIGGGSLEFTAQHKAREVAEGSSPQGITEFDMRGRNVDGDADMVCGGIQMVLIEQITPDQAPLFQRAATCFSEGAPGLWIIDISNPGQPDRSFSDLRHDAHPSFVIDLGIIMRSRTTRLIKERQKTLVLDPLPQSGTVVLFGGGHISREVAHLASYLDFEVIIYDDRLEFANKERFPMARESKVGDFTDVSSFFQQSSDLYVLILTRGHRYDQNVLAQVLRSPARYIGMIGSRRKRDIIYSNLRKQGLTDADFSRVHCPVGLSIGSETPKEIAVSIIGELIAARSGAL